MDACKQECKLCDQIITDGDFKVIDDVTKSVFEILLLNLTLDNDVQNVICTMCSSRLLAALNFKCTCIHTDYTIIPYVDFENPTTVDLKEIYAKEKVQERGGTFDNHKICRLCLQIASSDLKSIQEVPVETIRIYIPEINFAVTTNPVICIKCHDALCVHGSFIKNCLEVEKKRNAVPVDVGDILLADSRIKTEEIEIKDEEMDDETVSQISFYTEKLKKEEGDTPLYSHEGLEDAAETKGLYDPDDLKRTRAEPTTCDSHRKTKRQYLSKNRPKSVTEQVHQCDKCTFQTRHKQNLKLHQVAHKDPSELQKFECELCAYKTVRKYDFKKHQFSHKDCSEVRMYQCAECEFTTKRRANLIQHLLRHRAPSEIQMFECSQCGFKAKRKFTLAEHQLTHRRPAEVEMHQCEECEYKTKYKRYLKIHQLKHQDPSELQMFKCDRCAFVTKYKKSLKLHRSRHRKQIF